MALATAAALLPAACTRPEEPAPSPEGLPFAAALERLDPAAAPGALAPRMSLGPSGLRLSWIEPRAQGGHRLRQALFSGGAWEDATTVAEGDDFFANWADVPSVLEAPSGGLIAHWLARLGSGTYAYGVRLARSDDGGASWRPLGWLHDDRSPTEHGFVSLVSRSGAPPLALWLDGRHLVDGGPMELRAAELDGGDRSETVVDGRVCECCDTAAVASGDGVVVAYRDRSEEEIRDVYTARWDGRRWSSPLALGDAGWEIHGCPVNGPALAADGDRLVAAWFTAADSRPRVFVAFSEDAGRSFGPPRTVAEGRAAGRVAVALDDDGSALVAWLAAASERIGSDGQLLLRRMWPAGSGGAARAVAEVSMARATGFPSLVRDGDHAYLVWVEVAGEGESAAVQRLAVGRLSVVELP